MIKKNVIVGCKALIISYIITGIMLIVLSLLLYKLHWGMTVVYFGVILTYVVSNLIGAHILANHIRHKRFFVGLIFAAMYFVILMLISLVSGGGITGGFSETFKVLLVCACSAIFGSLF